MGAARLVFKAALPLAAARKDWVAMENLYKGRQIEPKVFKLQAGGFSIAADVITDEGGSVTIQNYFTDNTAATEEEAIKRAYALAQRAIDTLS